MARGDANWWFGENSVWQQSGIGSVLTGQTNNSSGKGFLDSLGVTVIHDIPEDQKMVLYAIGALVLFKLLMK